MYLGVYVVQDIGMSQDPARNQEELILQRGAGELQI